MKTIGDRLKFARSEAKLTQKRLAAISGVTQQMISRLETNKAESTTDIVPLATALDIHPKWLATGIGPMREPEHPATIAGRIRHARLKRGLSPEELAAVCGWETGKINAYEADEQQLPLNEVENLAQVLKVDGTWIYHGVGQGPDPRQPLHRVFASSWKNAKPPSPGASEANVETGPLIRRMVPLISWVAAGHWCEAIDNYAPGDAEEWLPCPEDCGPNSFALRVRGISMEPEFREGEIIFVDPSREVIHGKYVVVRLEEKNEVTFKQLIQEGDRKFLKALNPAWPEPLIEIDHAATICGVVIGRYKKL